MGLLEDAWDSIHTETFSAAQPTCLLRLPEQNAFFQLDDVQTGLVGRMLPHFLVPLGRKFNIPAGFFVDPFQPSGASAPDVGDVALFVMNQGDSGTTHLCGRLLDVNALGMGQFGNFGLGIIRQFGHVCDELVLGRLQDHPAARA